MDRELVELVQLEFLIGFAFSYHSVRQVMLCLVTSYVLSNK